MKSLLLFAALCAPLGLRAAEAPAPPVVQAPTLEPTQAPTPEPTVEVVKAPKLADPTPVPTEAPAATVKVYTRVPKDAFVASLWPGVFVHGWGHHVAGDQESFLNLAGGELFGCIMLGFGLSEALGPDIKDESKSTSQSIAVAGGAIFAVTWLWDVADAGSAATRFNKEHNLTLSPLPGGAQLALNARF